MDKKILILVMSLFSVFAMAQMGIGTQLSNGKLKVGGSIGVSFGNNSTTNINIAPSVGYMLSDHLEAGAFVGYQHSSSDYQSANLFSGGPYATYYVWQDLFARAQFEFYTGKQKIKSTDFSRNFNDQALWIGGGYQNQGIIKYQVGLMYNVLYDSDDPDRIFNSPLRPFGGISIAL